MPPDFHLRVKIIFESHLPPSFDSGAAVLCRRTGPPLTSSQAHTLGGQMDSGCSRAYPSSYAASLVIPRSDHKPGHRGHRRLRDGTGRDGTGRKLPGLTASQDPQQPCREVRRNQEQSAGVETQVAAAEHEPDGQGRGVVADQRFDHQDGTDDQR